ncbi:hypothetical protein AQUCO_00700866v1 [Aquilegia coerulea]|uniref:Uncharacterized protein n=1 Tax=Aquilegia coerulea TaxID=218851 RepID=A0A2G5EM12_AQUCA|nr:hypothetical protein AQUCO_00700866v1 [Aquilegia coerulea]
MKFETPKHIFLLRNPVCFISDNTISTTCNLLPLLSCLCLYFIKEFHICLLIPTCLMTHDPVSCEDNIGVP